MLDREFAFFEHLLRYGKNQSSCTIANHRVAYKNLRTFLAATVGEAGALPDPLFDPLPWLAWNRIKAKPPGEASMHTYWSKNRTFFHFLVEKHGIADPFSKTKAPTLSARVPKARTPAECASSTPRNTARGRPRLSDFALSRCSRSSCSPDFDGERSCS